MNNIFRGFRAFLLLSGLFIAIAIKQSHTNHAHVFWFVFNIRIGKQNSIEKQFKWNTKSAQLKKKKKKSRVSNLFLFRYCLYYILFLLRHWLLIFGKFIAHWTNRPDNTFRHYFELVENSVAHTINVSMKWHFCFCLFSFIVWRRFVGLIMPD